MNNVERILYPEREQEEQAQVTQHRQAVEAVRKCSEFFMVELTEGDIENILLKTGEKTWLEGRGRGPGGTR